MSFRTYTPKNYQLKRLFAFQTEQQMTCSLKLYFTLFLAEDKALFAGSNKKGTLSNPLKL